MTASNESSALIQRAAGSTIGSLFRARARLAPAAIALDDGRTRLSYAALDERVNRTAQALAELDVHATLAEAAQRLNLRTKLVPLLPCGLLARQRFLEDRRPRHRVTEARRGDRSARTRRPRQLRRRRQAAWRDRLCARRTRTRPRPPAAPPG